MIEPTFRAVPIQARFYFDLPRLAICIPTKGSCSPPLAYWEVARWTTVYTVLIRTKAGEVSTPIRGDGHISLRVVAINHSLSSGWATVFFFISLAMSLYVGGVTDF